MCICVSLPEQYQTEELLRMRMTQRSNRQPNECRRRDIQPGSSVIPRQQSRDNSQSTTNTGRVVSSLQMCQMTSGQEEECQRQDKEHGREGNSGTESGDPHDKGEETPGDEEDSEGIVEGVRVDCCAFVGGDDAEAWDKDGCV